MKTMEEIRRQGIAALERELGPLGTARFLNLFENGSGDYVQERHERHDEDEARKNAQAVDKGKMTTNA